MTRPAPPRRRPTRLAARRRRTVVLTLILTLVVACAIGLHQAWQASQSVAVPALVGMSHDQADRALSVNHLVADVHEEYSETAPKGQVMRMQPVGGSRVAKRSEVSVWVSRGPERHPMPAVVGTSRADAERAIRSASLTPGQVTTAWNETVASGKVVSASQPTGAKLTRDTTIDLVVSKGPRPIPIASWVGKPVADAQNALMAAGFKVTVTSKHDDTIAQGKIISQSPKSGTGHRGDTVKLVTSLGPTMVQVPGVRLKSEAQARSALEAAGFDVVVQYTTPDWLRVGIVSGEVPGGGSKQPKGSTITVYVS